MQSFEVQRVLEGEKAERSETARQLQEIERRLAAARPEQRATLEQKLLVLQEQIKEQSTQVTTPHSFALFPD